MVTENTTGSSNVSNSLKEKYDVQYTDDLTIWRDLNAITKANNIISVCKSLTIKNLLEVGSGEGAILQKLDESNLCENLYAVDISESAIQQLKKRHIASLKKASTFDGYKLPFDDNEFDLVVCSHVIEHVEYPRLLLREIKRVSKQQVFEIPTEFSFSVDKKVEHFLSYGHINIYTPSLFRFLLKSEGFEIVNQKVNLYSKATGQYINKKKKTELPFFKYVIFILKSNLIRFVWNNSPKKFQELKPQTYTVLTKSTEKELQIM